ncbi:hypothetical protein Ark11_1253 [Candidatus Ichthyocystis hellenicum]|uniref:Uncharacterized protein n=1 Tax=Candidatus Ichthyocystis hellenicum TaxID=1561003 RepID=A0A0S4M424_9BURK|nr:hypothetical protein [Candidatus Ichthyocystis hellenicum]CUT18059.1 hypothetical protein Ark11_1253 [Candidatus Ichthyocystis hellenicum]
MNTFDVVFCDYSPSSSSASSVENGCDGSHLSSCSLFSLSQNYNLSDADVITSPPPSIHTLSAGESFIPARDNSHSDINFDDGGDFGDLSDLLNHLLVKDSYHKDLSDLTLGITYLYYLSKCEKDELGFSSLIRREDIIENMVSQSYDVENFSAKVTARFINSVFAPIFSNFSANDRLELLHNIIRKVRPDIVHNGEVSSNACLKFFRDVKYERTTCGRLTKMCCVILFHNIFQDWISIGVCQLMSKYELDSWSMFRLISDFFRNNCCR